MSYSSTIFKLKFNSQVSLFEYEFNELQTEDLNQIVYQQNRLKTILFKKNRKIYSLKELGK